MSEPALSGAEPDLLLSARISVDLADGLAEGSASAVRFEEHIERKDTLKSLNLVGD